MTIEQIILYMSDILQTDEITEAVRSHTEIPELVSAVRCANMAVAELMPEFPVLLTVHASAEDGLIPAAALTGGAGRVIEVRCRGRRVHFTFDSRGVSVPFDGAFDVMYIAPPVDAELSDEVALGAGAELPIVAYLAARNYCLVTGRTDEATVWDQRCAAETERKRLARRCRLPRTGGLV